MQVYILARGPIDTIFPFGRFSSSQDVEIDEVGMFSSLQFLLQTFAMYRHEH